MKQSHKNFKLSMPSITEENHIIKGTSQSISLHQVEQQYQILSINDFYQSNNVGFFNKKTDFRIGEENSILVLDQNLEQVQLKTSEINNSHYLIYPIPFKFMEINPYFLYDHYISNDTIKVDLSFEFGEKLIKILLNLSRNKNELLSWGDIILMECVDYPVELYNLLISYNSYGYSINKNLLINSNPDFLLGILNGLDTNTFSNINIYTFTTILNYLGAMYSITRGYKDSRKINYQLPEFFSCHPKITNNFIRFKNDVKHINSILSLIDDNKKETVINSNLWNRVLNGDIVLIKASDLQFVKMEHKVDMYDFTMQRVDATNYSIPFGPILKNSDGDILGVIGIFGKESLKEAQEFSPENRDYFRSFNDGELQSWITKDAVLGLYNITKSIKK